MKTTYSEIFSFALLRVVVVFAFISFSERPLLAQCGSFISSFPYSEGFETAASWTSGGANSDWTWGTPSHPTISSAGGGNKSWCIGGLTGSSYNGSQESYLVSPCFDFTSLSSPWISFKVFWENEYKWDGATFQYSINNGTSWKNVGSYNDPVDCLNDNWFNYNNVSWLTQANPKHGWSGRVGATNGSCTGGNGSGQWLTAKHCMSILAGEPNVSFRFLFGSGNSCNNFDGFAIDDILIQNAASNTANFSFACVSGTDVSFTNLSSACSTSYLWDFGDPTSGSNNTSSLENPIHSFSGSGNFTVTLTSTGSCNSTGISTQTVKLISSNINTTDVSCNGGNDGTASVTATGTGTISYQWNTVPIQTSAKATGLKAGNYSLIISDAGGCPLTTNVVIKEPAVLTVTLNSSASCIDICNGSVSALASGGNTPYSYSWTSLGSGQNFNATVCSGNYTATVTDAKGCVANNTTIVTTNPSPQVISADANICIGSTAVLNAFGANTYSWSPATNLNTNIGASVEASPSNTTIYQLTGTSVLGCTATINVIVSVNNLLAPRSGFSFSPNEPTVLNPEVEFTNLTTGNNTYTWYFGELDSTTQTNPSYIFPSDLGSSYLVCLLATNQLGCSDKFCQLIAIDGITSVFIPNSFSPNNDGINDFFFPVLNDVSSEKFLFSVFDRWGEVIFSDNQLDSKWDGTFHNQACPSNSYIWKLRFTEKSTGSLRHMEGHVNLIK